MEAVDMQEAVRTMNRRERRWSRIRGSETVWGYFFIAPLVLGLFTFYIIPIVASAVLSFTNWDGSDHIRFIGFDNFVQLFADQKYLKSLRVTTVYALVTVPAALVFSIAAAVMLNRRLAGKNVYRLILFLPSVTMPVAIAVVWKWMYNGSNGLINYLLRLVGIEGLSWLTDERTILWSIMVVAVWMAVGYNMVILLSGLQGISESYYEAALLDGASAWRSFRHITLPLLTPSIFFVAVTGLIGAFQVFDLIFMMIPSAAGAFAGGILEDQVRTAVYSIYQNGFQLFKVGYASAQAWVLFLLILVITLMQLYWQKRWVHYE